MPDDDHRRQRLAHAEPVTEEDESEQRLYLDDGRQVAVVRDGGSQTVELRAASGQLELRIRLTEEGPVLSLDAVRLDVRAVESVDIQCKDFTVTASESATISSGGTAALKAAGDVEVEGEGAVRVVGKTIHLN